jgi:hypothetical protein
VAEKTYTVPEIRAKLAAALKGVLAKHEEDIANLRAREQKLSKHELCPLCSGPDINGMCRCLEQRLQKNAVQGYASSNGGQNMGPQTPGTQPMAMSEMCMCKNASYKMGKCESCGKPMKKAMNGEGDGGAAGMQLAEAGLSDVGSLSKKAPPGEEKLVHKLKDEYGHDKEGKEKAFATAWAVKNGTVNHKSETSMAKGGTTPHLDEVKPGLAKGMPSSSASALAPKPPAPVTSVAQANKEMGGFKSLAASPTHMPGKGGPSLTPGAGRKPLASMGRASHAVAGEIPNAKSENQGSARSPYGTGAAGHATQTNMPSSLKANMAGVAKSDKDPETKTTVGRGLDDKALPGTKPPKPGKKIEAEGSGGLIKGNPLRKDAEISPKKVGGQQPVGQGGGDAMKPVTTAVKAGVGTAPGLPKVGGQRPLASATDSPALQHFGRGAVDVNLEGARHRPLATAASSPGAQHFGRGAVDVDVSDLNGGAPAPVRGGVAFIRAAHAKARSAPVQSQRFHGALPLQRAELPPTAPAAVPKKYPTLGKGAEHCALCKGAEHPGAC